MPERPSDAEDADQDREAVGPDEGGAGKPSTGEPGTDPDGPAQGADESEEARKARIEAAKRRYRATLRNEAEIGGGGFSEDYYRSQKPPHWS
ncbi:hypothetical protein [Brevibacterium pigmentatum]|uniref:hypothetical protein n=1 Tax=Brevibacterium pigmentatum TaxID=1496080 RepID=UPI00141DE8E2|nr:hypothetical protein [Brevibacterium pigmentatum]